MLQVVFLSFQLKKVLFAIYTNKIRIEHLKYLCTSLVPRLHPSRLFCSEREPDLQSHMTKTGD